MIFRLIHCMVESLKAKWSQGSGQTKNGSQNPIRIGSQGAVEPCQENGNPLLQPDLGGELAGACGRALIHGAQLSKARKNGMNPQPCGPTTRRDRH